MDLNSVDKYLKLQQYPSHTEVKYNGQPCLAVVESAEGFYWKVVPLFARMVYGAETYADIPYCVESFGDMSEAIADGIAQLHELGAFIEYDFEQFDDNRVQMQTEECLELATMYGNDLFESSEIFDEMMSEDRKQIDELSKGTLSSYVTKSLDDKASLAKKYFSKNKDEKEDLRKITNRRVGVEKARDKMSEEVEQLDEVDNPFTQVFGPKKDKPSYGGSSYTLPGHVVLDVKNGPNGETHVKRISHTGAVTTTKYNTAGAAVGKIRHDDEDPKPHFKAAGNELPKKKRGRPAKSGAEAGSSHEVVKAKIDKGETLSRYEKYIAQKHGLVTKGKAGRKAAPISDEKSEKLFGTLMNRSLKKAEKAQKNEEVEVEQIEEKITAKTPTKDVIADFIKSDAPQFKGKSKSERIRMALGASYAAKKD